MRLLLRALAVVAFITFGVVLSPAWSQDKTPAGLGRATFAGGCFWCTEVDFDKVPGVVSTTSGYIGGKTANPTYEQIGRGDTGHAEAVEVVFDPKVVTYARLVEIYWRTIDPLDAGGQFCDRGSQYRPEIFVHSDEQRAIAEASKKSLVDAKRFPRPIVVAITDATKFTAAEDYHQDFVKKSPLRYYTYRSGCGRDGRLQSLWGDEAGGKKLLTQ